MSSTPLAAAPLLLTAKNTARVLAVCPKTLWALTRSGRLPAVRIGTRGVRYDVTDVRAFISASKDKGGAASEH
jgi:excisionase family DNA binding protein